MYSNLVDAGVNILGEYVLCLFHLYIYHIRYTWDFFIRHTACLESVPARSRDFKIIL